MTRWSIVATLGGVCVFMIDHLTKLFFYNHPSKLITLIPNWLWLKFHLNTDMALSLPLYPMIYFSLTLVVLAALLWRLVYTIRHRVQTEFILIIFILAGALGNLADRFLYGGVVDFIQIRLGSIFNLADVSIVTAVGIWIGLMLHHDKQNKHKKVPAAS